MKNRKINVSIKKLSAKEYKDIISKTQFVTFRGKATMQQSFQYELARLRFCTAFLQENEGYTGSMDLNPKIREMLDDDVTAMFDVIWRWYYDILNKYFTPRYSIDSMAVADLTRMATIVMLGRTDNRTYTKPDKIFYLRSLKAAISIMEAGKYKLVDGLIGPVFLKHLNTYIEIANS